MVYTFIILDIINNIRNFIQTSFLTDVPESNVLIINYLQPDPTEAKNNTEIQITVNNAWDGKNIHDDERKIVKCF